MFAGDLTVAILCHKTGGISCLNVTVIKPAQSNSGTARH